MQKTNNINAKQRTAEGRDLDGDLSTAEAYYDTVLEITWMANANYTGTPSNWDNATSSVASLNPYGSGIQGWRLPATNQTNDNTSDDHVESYIGTRDTGYNISAPGTLYSGSTASEMAHMFYNTLGNKALCDPVLSTETTCSGPVPGYGLSSTGAFLANSGNYWSNTIYTSRNDSRWALDFRFGNQGGLERQYSLYAWPVHDGGVGTPIFTATMITCIGSDTGTFDAPLDVPLTVNKRAR